MDCMHTMHLCYCCIPERYGSLLTLIEAIHVSQVQKLSESNGKNATEIPESAACRFIVETIACLQLKRP